MTAPAVRRKRLRMRCWRRGMREMDLILGGYADAKLAVMDEDDLDRFEALLEIDDQTLFAMFSGAAPETPDAAPMLHRIRDFHHLQERQ